MIIERKPHDAVYTFEGIKGQFAHVTNLTKKDAKQFMKSLNKHERDDFVLGNPIICTSKLVSDIIAENIKVGTYRRLDETSPSID